MEQFFGTQGYTSTSANHLCNVAKEYYTPIEKELNSIEFFQTDVNLIGSSDKSKIKQGVSSEFLAKIPEMLQNITEAKNLISWLREAIKERDRLFKEIEDYTLQRFCRENNLEYPLKPIGYPTLTIESYMESLSIKERNEFLSLQNKCATLGFVHIDGAFNKARKALTDKINTPFGITGSGRDALIYTYTPTVNTKEVDDLFFKLQQEHREAQARLNEYKFKRDEAIRQSVEDVHDKYSKESSEYYARMSELENQLITYKQQKIREIAALKIVIPHHLESILKKIQSLSK